MSKLKSFLCNSVEETTVREMSNGTGIEESNINRFMNNKDFMKSVEKEKNNTNINL